MPGGRVAQRHAVAVADVAAQLRPAPKAAIGRRLLQGGEQLGPLVGRELRRLAITGPAVGQAVGTVLVVAFDQSADPVAGEADKPGRRVGGARLIGAVQKPEDLPRVFSTGWRRAR